MRGVTKFFEIRDTATFIPVIATALSSDIYEEAYLIGRAGYRNHEGLMVTRLVDCHSANDYREWGNRTMQTAHKYIEDHFYTLQTGAVVDVQFIVGETDTPKRSERFEVRT